jgi:opacity protein-like surface antigen
MRKASFHLCIVVLVFSSFTFAQTDEPAFHRWTLKFGGGATIPTGESHDRLTTGWHFLGGGGINFNRRFGVLGEFQWNELGVTSSVVQTLGVPGADAHVMSVTANPFIKLSTGRVQPYIIGGVGYYRRTVDLTQPATQVVTFFDPFFGFVNGVVPTNQIIGTISRNAFGRECRCRDERSIQWRRLLRGGSLPPCRYAAYRNPVRSDQRGIPVVAGQ